MAEQHRYMFDVDFTPAHQKPPKDEPGSVGADDGVSNEPPPPPAPTFSEEELNLARDTAFDEGRRTGYSEGLEAGGVQIANTLQALVQSLPLVVQAQEASNDQILQDSVRLTVATLRRAFPAVAENHAFDEVAKVVADLVPHLLDEPRIIVRVAQPLVETIRERLEQIANSTGFEGRMVVQEDARLKPGDCKVEWADGGAERDVSRLMTEMEQIVDRALKSVSAPASGGGQPAAPAPTQEENING